MLLPLRFWACLFVLILYNSIFEQVQAQVYYLDLSHQEVMLPHRLLHVEQVVDGRPGHPTIGIVYRGLENRPTAVLFRNGLEAELTTFLQKQLPARPADHSVVLCLRQLRISEQLNGVTELASADLAADVYEHLPSGYHFVRSVAARTADRALETTAKHPAHIALLLQQCLGQISASDWPQAQTAPVRTLRQLADDNPTAVAEVADSKRTVPAIIRESPRRGVYNSFEQFLMNQPDTTLVVRADTVPLRLRGKNGRLLWLGVARFQPVVVDGQGKTQPIAKSCWGFSDGKNLYVQHEKQYFPLVRQANFFTFVGEKPVDIEYLRARSEAQARAMITGVAKVHEQDHSGEPLPYAVDMRTGQFAPYPDPLRRRPVQPDTSYVYIYRQTDVSTTPVAVFLDGKEVGRLRPNEYIELQWPYYARMMRLCLGVPTSNPCQLLVPDAAKLNYLKISTTSPTATTGWQWMPATLGEADLDTIDKVRSSSTK